MLELDRAKKIGGENTLTETDLREFNTAEKQIFAYMRTHDWVCEDELIELTGQRQAARRMRALRNERWDVVKKCINKRTWIYKLIRRPDPQGRLFKGESDA